MMIYKDFQGNLLYASPSIEQLHQAAVDYEAIALANLHLIIDRYRRKPDYHWIDTKISLITGEDFDEDDLLRGPETIYGMIQGRALESLTGHAKWLSKQGDDMGVLVDQINPILREVLTQVTTAWKKNGGHMFYWMTPDGRAFTLNVNGKMETKTLTSASPYNCSDLFCCKGMYAAAKYLEDEASAKKAKTYCLDTAKAVWDNKYRSDQIQLDPKNQVETIPGRNEHGNNMIQIDAARILAEYDEDLSVVDMGLKSIRYILDHHVNLKKNWQSLHKHDFVEFIDDFGNLYEESGRILSDSGHALEFVGLSLKFISLIKRFPRLSREQKIEIEDIESVMPGILKQNFTNGFQPKVGGICKLFDLAGRKPINSDMPWWSLPEAMRSALLCYQLTKDPMCLEILSQCHNAFFKNYVRTDLNLMAYQTRDENGRVVDVIPASPDADPSYHTGLSLLDCITVIQNMRK